MEKNIHDDAMDHYVRKSFEDFEDMPSQDMWSRVSNALDQEEEQRPVPFYIVWGRQVRGIAKIAAVLALFFGGVWVGRLHWGSESAVAVQTASPRPAQSTAAPAVAAPQAPAVTQQGATAGLDGTPLPQSVSGSTAPARPNTPNVQKTAQLPKNTRDLAQYQQKKSAHTSAHTEELAHNTAQNSVAFRPLSEVETGEMPQPPVPATPDPTTAAQQAHTATAETVLVPLPTAAAPAALVRNASRPDVSVPPTPAAITKVAPKSKAQWYMALDLGRFQAKDRPKPPAPNGGPMPFRWASRVEKPAPSTELALRLGRVYSRGWGWETGLGYRTLTRSAVHLPRFRFQDGVPGPGSQGFDFNYDLDTYGGTTAVTLRMEQVDSSVPLPPTQAVSARVHTRETINLLRMPVLATYQLQKGRFSVLLKAGLVPHYMLKSTIEIRQRESTASQFKVGQYVALTKQPPRPFFMGYQGSVALGYRVAPRVSILAEPTISGEFNRKTPNKTTLPGMVLMGASVGVRVDI